MLLLAPFGRSAAKTELYCGHKLSIILNSWRSQGCAPRNIVKAVKCTSFKSSSLLYFNYYYHYHYYYYFQ